MWRAAGNGLGGDGSVGVKTSSGWRPPRRTGESSRVRALLAAGAGALAALAADRGPATPGELAARTGTAERYVREWLEQQAVAS